MTNPSSPEQKGEKGVVFDGMPEAGHKEQQEKACKGESSEFKEE